MRRMLVTGGAGFIGVNFVRYWLDRHPEDRVVVLDALTYAGNPASLAGLDRRSGFRFVHGDVRDASLVEETLLGERVDTVVHFAAESHVDRSIHGPDVFLETNVLGTASMLKAARAAWARSERGRDVVFHHVSTDEVYGSLGPDDPPFDEETRYDPRSPYSASKAAADHLVNAYHHTYGLPVTISNCTNNYGPYQYPEKLVPLVIANALDGRPIGIYGDGRNVRDWLHVKDHCRGIEAILERGRRGETYAIGGRAETENRDLVHRLCDEIDDLFAERPELAERYPRSPAASGEASRSLVTYVEDRRGHDRRYAVDGSKIERELGHRPSMPLETGLRDTVRWYVDHEEWWRPLARPGPPPDRGEGKDTGRSWKHAGT